jgi:hypothetical protein
LAFWKIINEEDPILILNKSRRETFQRIFALGNVFGGGLNGFAATPLIVVLFPGNSDITRLTVIKQRFLYFRMSSATFDKLLVLLGPSFTFQDTRTRKSAPPEERLAVTLRKK